MLFIVIPLAKMMSGDVDQMADVLFAHLARHLLPLYSALHLWSKVE